MKIVEFGTLFQFIRNGMSVKQDKSGDGLPVTRIETISNATVDGSRVGYAGLKEADCRGWFLENGDILFSHINSVEHIGKCAVYRGEPEKLVHGMNLLCLRCDKTKLIPEFAKYLIRGPEFRTRLANFTNKAVNQASVSIGNMKTIPVSVPPLAEQKRIAAILDAADALRTKRRESLAQLDALLQSTFLTLFGDPVTNPMGWETANLENLSIKVTDGDHHTPIRTESGIKLLSARNVLNGEIDFSNTDFVGEAEYARMIKRCHPERGDVLISCSGSIGRVSRIKFDEPVVLVRSAALVKIDHAKTFPEFVEYLLRTPALQIAMQRAAKSVAQANLFQQPIKNLPVFIPPLPLQQKFAAIVESVERQKAAQRAHLAELDALFAALQHRAFRGEL